MSSGTEGNNGTLVVAGPDTIQVADFYVKASILHPLVIGSIAIIVLFTALRLISNRSVAAMNVTDWIVNVAIGSTLAGIVNGNSLVRGLLGLATILGFQWLSSLLGAHLPLAPSRFSYLLASPPIVIAFRGRLLTKVMSSHRVSQSDLYAALRQRGILSVDEIECVFVEANGSFSIYMASQVKGVPEDGRDVLMQVPGYRLLCEDAEARGVDGTGDGKKCGRCESHECDHQQNEVAGEAC